MLSMLIEVILQGGILFSFVLSSSDRVYHRHIVV